MPSWTWRSCPFSPAHSPRSTNSCTSPSCDFSASAFVAGMPTSFDDEREQIVYEMAIVLSGGRWVSRGLHERAVKALGHVGVTDVITLMGHYTSVAMTLAFYDVPEGATGMAR